MSTVVLYCWCHSDSASVLLYFTFKCAEIKKKFREYDWTQCKIEESICTVTVTPRIEYHGGYSWTPIKKAEVRPGAREESASPVRIQALS